MTQEKTPVRRRKTLSVKESSTLKKVWGYKCAYCDTYQKCLVLDHIIPFSKGGSCELSNLAPSCERCNQRKSNHEIPETYLALILAIADKKAKETKKALKTLKKVIKKTPKKPCEAKNKVPVIRGRRYNDIRDGWGSTPDKIKEVFSVLLDNLLDGKFHDYEAGTKNIKRSFFKCAGLESFYESVVGYDYCVEYYDEDKGDWASEILVQYSGGMISYNDDSGYICYGLSKHFKQRLSELLGRG